MPQSQSSLSAVSASGDSLGVDATVHLGSAYATRLSELTVPWEAARPDDPMLLALNSSLARTLGLDPAWLESESGIRFLLGNDLPEGSVPVAQVYSGHQFGSYASRLGDGRALLLGELTHEDGRLRDLHLKGSGRTPFARADGFAAVGPMLREHLMSEAMHAMGISTTRSLAVVETGRMVLRDAELLPGAVLARVASSHLRVGTFQYARSTGEEELLRRLADFAIERHYPELAEADEPYAELLSAVVDAQASLVASWMLVGFVHGVMNTDNTTISGETIDYGPCAFIDAYEPSTVFSSIDTVGRYAYGNQPGIMQWNVSRFADALLPLLHPEHDRAIEIAEDRVRGFGPAYGSAWLRGIRDKLGLSANAEDEMVSKLAAELLAELQSHRIDFTEFFRALSYAAAGDSSRLQQLFPDEETPGGWYAEWSGLGADAELMFGVNPAYIPRNHIVDEALAVASDGDLAPFEALLSVVTHPYEERPELDRFAHPSPHGARPHVTYCGT